MYTLENLQQKNLKELKEIGYQLNALPDGNKRCRQNWIDVIADVLPPLLEPLETSPGVEVESAHEPIEIQRQEPIEYGRITGYLCSPKPIALADIPVPRGVNGKTTETDRPTDLRAELHLPGVDTAEPYASSSGIESSTLEYKESDRVLAAAGNDRRDSRRDLLDLSIELAATFNDEQPPNRGDGGRGRLESEPILSQSAIGFCASPVTFSPRFLATYPPYFGEIHYKAEVGGQLNLLEPETGDEPPDPDDFESIDAFQSAIALWDAEHPPEPLEVSMTSMREWAPCPLEWYEPETIEINETNSITLEMPPVSILFESCAHESSDTLDFSIPVFGGFADRPNERDEPPTAGVGARRPLPKPPSFPPTVVAAGDRSSIKKFARCAIHSSGRAPPGGDAIPA